MKHGTIKSFNSSGELLHYWTFSTQSAYDKAIAYCKMNCAFWEVIFEGEIN